MALFLALLAGIVLVFLYCLGAYLRHERVRERRLIDSIPNAGMLTKNRLGLASGVCVYGPACCDEHVPIIMSMRHLKAVFIDGTSISVDGVATIAGHPRIRLLAIAQSAFGDRELKAILANLHASELELLKMNLLPGCITLFSDATKLRLRRLVLPRSAKEWSNLEDFRLVLPGCEISFA